MSLTAAVSHAALAAPAVVGAALGDAYFVVPPVSPGAVVGLLLIGAGAAALAWVWDLTRPARIGDVGRTPPPPPAPPVPHQRQNRRTR